MIWYDLILYDIHIISKHVMLHDNKSISVTSLLSNLVELNRNTSQSINKIVCYTKNIAACL